METTPAAPPPAELIDQKSIDISDETFAPFEEQFAEETDATPEVEASEKKQGLLRKLGSFGLKVAKGESIGTVLDVASIAVGIPIAIREAAGSTLDYKIYGEDDEKKEDKERSRVKKLRMAIGTVALYSVSGMLAQKYGSEIAGAMRDSLNDGTMGTYITPLVSKLGAVFGVNAVVNKLKR